MAYQEFARYEVYSYEQQEEWTYDIEEKPDGTTEQIKVLKQPYAKIIGELVCKQEPNASENTSSIRVELWAHVETGENGAGLSLTTLTSDSYNRLSSYLLMGNRISNTYCYLSERSGLQPEKIFEEKIKKGNKVSKLVRLWTNTGISGAYGHSGLTGFNTPKAIHALDGSFKTFWYTKTNQYQTGFEFNIQGNFIVTTELKVKGETKTIRHEASFEHSPTIPAINRATVLITADNFTDETDASISYSFYGGKSIVNVAEEGRQPKYTIIDDEIDTLEVGLSFDGVNLDIPYRHLATDGSYYAFDFTEEQREMFRTKTKEYGSNNVPIYYMTRTMRHIEYHFLDGGYVVQPDEHIQEGATKRILTIVGAEPLMNPTVRDVHARANYLTGSEDKFVRYLSHAEFSINPVASKYAHIISRSVKNGMQIVEDVNEGIIENIDSNTFYFAATDSRNLTARDFIIVDLVPYIKPTSSITSAVFTTDGILTFSCTGNFYNGSFGVVENSLQFEYSIRESSGDVTWHIFEPDKIKITGNTYTITHGITGLDYRKTYTITANVIDEAMSAQTEPRTISSIPIFDWSDKDFNHNTKVTFQKDIELADGVNLISNDIRVNGFDVGHNQLLWYGANKMPKDQVIELADSIQNQTNGIVLVFSLFRNNSTEDVSINSFFISKKEVELLAGAPHSFLMLINAGFSKIGAKYLYIYNDRIEGHEGNTTSGANSNINFDNTGFVLRYVIGV